MTSAGQPEEIPAVQAPNPERSITRVVRKRRLDDPDDDVEYWRSRPPEERIAALEEIRSQYHRWIGLTENRIERVFTVVKQSKQAVARPQDLVDLDTLK